MSEIPAKPTRRKQDRPDEIVNAALEVFSEVGFGRATIAEIARRAGAGKGTVYLYFETKADLFEAVVRRFMSPTFQHFDKLLRFYPGSTRSLLSQMLKRAYKSLPGNEVRRAILKILLAEGSEFPELTKLYHREVLSGATRMISEVIQRGIDRGEFRDSAAAAHPQVIMGPLIASAVWKMTFDEIDPIDLETIAEVHIDLLFNGLEVPKKS